MSKMMRLFFAFLFTSCLLLACRLSAVGLPSTPSPSLPVSSEEAAALERNLEQALREKGRFTLEITERQLNSYIAVNLEKYIKDRSITDVQVYFQDEKIVLSGVLHQDNLQLPIRLVGWIGLDSPGNLVVEIAEAKVGPFPLPQSMVDRIAAEIRRALLEQIAVSGSNLTLEEVLIGEDSILIRGTKQ